MRKVRPQYEIVPINEDSGLIFRDFKYPILDVDWHSHEEYEITFIKEGNGERIIGNNVDHFFKGDLVFIGPNLPHLYRGESIGNETLAAHCLVIQLNNAFFDNEFFELIEFQKIKKLILDTSRGIRFSFEVANKIGHEMDLFRQLNGVEKISELLKMLNFMANDTQYELLSENTTSQTQIKDIDKAKSIYRFILDNYTGDIQLAEVARLANLSKAGFCNYIKKKTQKSYSELINELRIKKSCHYLSETNETIAQISYQVGFNNLGYFNRVFKLLIGMTPKEYRLKSSIKSPLSEVCQISI
ncbi:MAG: AraC family transcriptional regulator [Candidatus Paceibacterota bacterium]